MVSVSVTSQAAEVHELVFGPVRVEANTMGSGHTHDLVLERPVQFPKDLWLTNLEASLVDGAGHPLPHQLFCHSTLFDPRDPADPVGAFGFGATRLPAHSTLAFPEGTAMLLRSGETYRWSTMFRNPFGRVYPEVYLRIRLTVEPVGEESSSTRQALQPCCISVNRSPLPLTWLYTVPPGQSIKQREERLPIAGRVALVSSHLHRYGVRLILERLDGDSGIPHLIWEARPTKPVNHPDDPMAWPEISLSGDDPTIWLSGGVFGMPMWRPEGEWRVTPGNRFRLTAEYDNPTGQDWPIAVGVMCFFIVPESTLSE